MKYDNGKIYKLIDNTNGNIYIGSTIQKLSKRKSEHKADAKSKNCKSKSIIENGDYDIILIENYPCKSKEELLMRERYYIDNTDCINQVRSHISKDERKKYLNKYNKNYKTVNKDQIKEYQLDYDKKRRVYQISWGGDSRYHNNLLKINVNLFLY